MTPDIRYQRRPSPRLRSRGVFFMLLLLAWAGMGFSSVDNARYSIIPDPVSLIPKEGSFTFGPETRIVVSPLDVDTRLAAEFLARLVKNPTGLTVPLEEGTSQRTHAVCMSLGTFLIVQRKPAAQAA